jgi:hypothetical protein
LSLVELVVPSRAYSYAYPDINTLTGLLLVGTLLAGSDSDTRNVRLPGSE